MYQCTCFKCTHSSCVLIYHFILQGVVVIEEIKRLKSKLQLETTSTEEMVECLNKLGQKIPPRHVMLDTKIGEIVCTISNIAYCIFA